jgi:hypothetical protein
LLLVGVVNLGEGPGVVVSSVLNLSRDISPTEDEVTGDGVLVVLTENNDGTESAIEGCLMSSNSGPNITEL